MKTYIDGNNYLRIDSTSPSHAIEGIVIGTGYFTGINQVSIEGEVTLTVAGVKDLIKYLQDFIQKTEQTY